MTSEKRRVVNASMDEAFERAVNSHIIGDIDYARYVCQRILQVDPGNVLAAYHLRLVEHHRSMPVMVRNLVEPNVPAAPVIFDVGAHNGGLAAVYREVFPEATIHAFEPVPDLAAKTQERFAGDPRVIVNPVGVGAQEGELTLHIHRGGGNDAISSFLELNPENDTGKYLEAKTISDITVEVVSLDGYCAKNGIDRIDFLKLDVQGFEDKCLAGAQTLLKNHAIGVIQVEVLLSDMYAKTLTFYDIEQYLVPAGYKLYAIDDVYPRIGAALFQLDAFYVSPPVWAAAREREIAKAAAAKAQQS